MRMVSALVLLLSLLAGEVVAQPGGGGPQGFRPPTDPLFDALDRNNDGELSAEELEQAAAALKRLDRNNDGQLAGQEIPQPRFGGGRGGPGGGRRETKLLDQFDADKDGRLNDAERSQARAFQQQNAANSQRRGRPGGGENAPQTGPGPKVSPDEVATVRDRELYDEAVLRTVFLEFPRDDWEKELATFYRTDVDVPARMTVDGKVYKDVGVAFRGNSSFFTVGEGQKRSLNVRTDYANAKQDLYGYRTLNFLNAHTDPSFLRTTLYNHIARHYIPAPGSNFVRVVINGESWGIYVNAQQYNKEFVDEWFGSRKGVRWKVPAGGGGRSLTYNGEDREDYAAYELKSAENDEAWTDLIAMTKALAETPVEKLDTELDKILNVDRALWFLALDNVLIDSDGYYSRGSDYFMYQEPKFGRFHVIPYDSNETFRTPGGGGPGGPGGRGGRGGGFGPPGGFGGQPQGVGRPDQGRGPGGRPDQGGRPDPGQRPDQRRRPDGGPDQRGGQDQGGRGQGGGPLALDLSPFQGEDNQERPLLNRLLANPRLRARYVAHVRTITEQWLDWERIGPVIESYRALIDGELKQDTRMLYGYEQFARSLTETSGSRRPTPGLQPFVEGRGRYLRSIPELQAKPPVFASVREVGPDSPGTMVVEVALAEGVDAASVTLYYSPAPNAPFAALPMSRQGQAWRATIPAQPAGSLVAWYVGAEAADEFGTTAFEPASTEVGARKYRVQAEHADGSPVLISEIMAANKRTIADPQGEYDDYIELVNVSNQPVDLSGAWLSDSRENPRKWQFPAGTVIKPGGYLLVWADEDGKAEGGLHANFKLSRTAETVLLIDRDEKQNRILDEVEWANLRSDVAFARDGRKGQFQPQTATPGTANKQGQR